MVMAERSWEGELPVPYGDESQHFFDQPVA